MVISIRGSRSQTSADCCHCLLGKTALARVTRLQRPLCIDQSSRQKKRPPGGGLSVIWCWSAIPAPPRANRSLIRLADAALYSPTRSAAVPRAPSATTVVVIVMMMAMADINLECRGGDHATASYDANHTQNRSNLSYGSYDCSSFVEEITRNGRPELHSRNLNGCSGSREQTLVMHSF